VSQDRQTGVFMLKKFIKAAASGAALLVLFAAAAGCALPRTMSVFEGGEYRLDIPFPATVDVQADGSVELTVNRLPTGRCALRAGEVGGPGTAEADVKLFGMLHLCSIEVDVLPRPELIPCGSTVGVRMLTDGVMVIGLSDVETERGMENPAFEAGIMAGDIIMRVAGEPARSITDLAAAVERAGGAPLELMIQRGGQQKELSLNPVRDISSGAWKIGLWTRDSAAGIGTVTFIEPSSGLFGALGHGICDVDTGELMPFLSGEITQSSVVDVKKGRAGEPGELHGAFGDEPIGELIQNGSTGIFGYSDGDLLPCGADAMPIALRGEVTTGRAQILSNITGSKVEEFEIEITKINKDESNKSRNMLIRVTDSRLIDRTGGIVQGMSGSPIIQNGKLVGAVTHVLVDDSRRGYGIFIENMLIDAASAAQGSAAPDGPADAA